MGLKGSLHNYIQKKNTLFFDFKIGRSFFTKNSLPPFSCLFKIFDQRWPAAAVRCCFSAACSLPELQQGGRLVEVVGQQWPVVGEA